jgi:hypothetical protein
MMGNKSATSIHGVRTVDLKLTSGRTIHLKNMCHAPTKSKHLITVSLLCRDGYKLVFESNKIIMFKFGNFLGKFYISAGLFHLSTFHYSHNLNIASVTNNKICEADVCHSHFCDIGFDTIARMSKLELFLKLNIVKGSKCQSYVQAKQT